MYSVSDEYLSKIKDNGRITRITGTLTLDDGTEVEITNDSIAKNPVITNQCSGNDELVLGQAYQGQLKVSLYSDINRYTIYGAEITLAFGLCLDEDADTWEDVPLGVYYVTECIRTSNDVLQITAVDHIDALDIDYDGTTVSGTPYEILSQAKTYSGLTLGQTSDEIAALPNGSTTFGISESNHKSQTWRDVVGDLAACLCGFAYMDRNGKLCIGQFSTETTRTITDDYRFKDTISDYEVIYSSVTCDKGDTVISVGTAKNQNLDLGDNDFLQLGTDETTTAVLTNILNVVSAVTYTPSDIEWYGDPALDMGDLIEATGYAAKKSTLIPLQKFTWTWRARHKIVSSGKNPYLGEAKSVLDKKVENITKTQQTIESGLHLVTNTTEVGFSDEWKILGQCSFVCLTSQISTFNGVVKLNMDAAGSVKIKYQINGVDYYFIHICQVPEGIHTLTLFIPVHGKLNVINSLKVYIMSEDSSGLVNALDFNGGISGSGISDIDWDGYIVLDDIVPKYEIAGLTQTVTGDSATVTLYNPIVTSVEDKIPVQNIAYLPIPTLSDECVVILERLKQQIDTEDGNNFITEDGNLIITEGGIE